MNTYRPLPKELRLGLSKIHDIGVFAKEKIRIGHDFGISHLKINDQLFRTPLGGFINHAEDNNCVKTELRDENFTKKWNLIALRNIKEGEELTLKYTFYKV